MPCTKTRVKKTIGLLLFAFLAGCGDNTNQVASLPAISPALQTDQTASLDARTMQMWSHSCALCHVDGTAGAPRLGDADDWRERLTKGDDLLLRHTIEGFNDMPPLGYCMACENKHFVAMIRFMSGRVKHAEAQ